MDDSSLEQNKAKGLCPFCNDNPCQCTPERHSARQALENYGIDPSTSTLLSKDKAKIENFSPPLAIDRKTYGAVPHFAKRDQIIDNFANEARYFGKHYDPKTDTNRRARFFAEGALLFEMKFGRRLSEFAEEILANYPDLKRQGKDVSVFGLSGAGKSSSIEAIAEKLGENTIVIDSDTVRYNLLAKMIKDVETKNGASIDHVRQNLMHNNISGALHFLLNYVGRELCSRGYNVIRSSTLPGDNADITFYIEHPDGIDPRKITDEQIPTIAKTLFKRTQGRTNGPDNYNWDNATTITDFRQMRNVSVQVPERNHGIFVKNIRSALEQDKTGRIIVLKNKKNDDPIARKQIITEQLEGIL